MEIERELFRDKGKFPQFRVTDVHIGTGSTGIKPHKQNKT